MQGNKPKLQYTPFELSMRIIDTTLLTVATILVAFYLCALTIRYVNYQFAVIAVLGIVICTALVYVLILGLKIACDYSGIANIAVLFLQSVIISAYCIMFIILQYLMLRVSFMNKMFVVNAVIVTALDLGIESLASIKRSKRSEELMNQIYY